ncbi:MAG: SRPBCC family protein [Bacteroidales bacterium]
MEYTTEVIIDLPLQEVIRIFDNTENSYWWQPGLKDIKMIKGEDRTEGTVYRMVYEGRRSDLVVEETVLAARLPAEYTTVSRSPGVVNTVRNVFASSGEGTTRWQTVNQFQFRGMMRWMAPFMKQAFRSNTLLSMERFRMYAENENRSTTQNKS